MSAPGSITGGVIGETVSGYAVTEVAYNQFSVTQNVSQIFVNGVTIPDDTYTYVGDLGTNTYNNPVFYSSTTGKYFIPALDLTPSSGVVVGSVQSYKYSHKTNIDSTALTSGVQSMYDYNTETETVTPCFCPGTLIATPVDEVPVERLAIGDAILNAAGQSCRIKWIGRRSYSSRHAARCPNLLPVCIKAGAFDGRLPRRDLFVSPRHAFLLDGILIEAGLLMNGISIFRTSGLSAGPIRYLHIELERHDILLAEGAATESFTDDDSRSMFQNAAEYFELYPDARAKPARFCNPRVGHGYALEAIRQRIALRAQDTSFRARTCAIQAHLEIDPWR